VFPRFSLEFWLCLGVDELLGELVNEFREFPLELIALLGELVVEFLEVTLFLVGELLVTAVVLGLELFLGLTSVPELLFLSVGEF
jgi:hypothetical protein